MFEFASTQKRTTKWSSIFVAEREKYRNQRLLLRSKGTRASTSFFFRSAEPGFKSSFFYKKKRAHQKVSSIFVAEREGFEPSEPCGSPLFESGQFNHSCTSPDDSGYKILF
jgi:hypothetical protein